MSNNPNQTNNNGSSIWYDTKSTDLNTVTLGPDGGHLHIAYNSQGQIHHTDYTLSTGDKLDVNPDVAGSLAAFLSGK